MLKKFAGLKIGMGDNEKVLIDEFGSPTKEGLLAAVLGVLSALGALILAKDFVVYKITKAVNKRKKQIRKASESKTKVKNQALKQQNREQSSAIKLQAKENQELIRELEKLKKQLEKQPESESASDALVNLIKSQVKKSF